MRALLDVNVLIALLDAAHIGHQRAHHWLAAHGSAGWASCPMTQNGCIRIMAQASYPGALPAADVAGRLAEATQHSSHRFWPDAIDYLQVNLRGVIGHRQVTDAYLASLARHHGGKLATFDQGLAALHPDGVELVPG